MKTIAGFSSKQLLVRVQTITLHRFCSTTSTSEGRIKTLCNEKRLHEAIHQTQILQQQGTLITEGIFNDLLQLCIPAKDLNATKKLYSLLSSSELISITSYSDQLIRLFSSCGDIQAARDVFSNVTCPSLYTWNAIISAYAKSGSRDETLGLYHSLVRNGFCPDKFTFLGVFKACIAQQHVEEIRIIHSSVVKSGLDMVDVIVSNALVDTYLRCGLLEEGQVVFQLVPCKNVVTWATMINGYVNSGQGDLALELYREMHHSSVMPDNFLMSSISNACSSIGDLKHGRLIHHEILYSGHEVDLVVGNTLVDMYIKCRSLQEARNMFDGLRRRDIVSWNSMIAGYSEHGDGVPALELFEKMQDCGMSPNVITYASALKACGSIGALGQGRYIHNSISKQGLQLDSILEVALVDMYAKCGSFTDAYEILNQGPRKGVESWNALIAGCAHDGNHALAAVYLEDMKRQGLEPNCRTYNSILAACSHAGQVEEGCRHFQNMVENHDIKPDFEHFNCMVDLLGRAGRLHEADELMHTKPTDPCVVGWRAMLASCRVHGYTDLGSDCYGQMMHLVPEDASCYMLMANMHADACNWVAVIKTQALRKHAAAWKKPGTAWIEVKDKVYEFKVGEKRFIESDNKLRQLNREFRAVGFIPQVDAVVDINNQSLSTNTN